MDTYKIGQQVYNTTNPNLSGMITGYSGENYTVTTEKGDVEWNPKCLDFHESTQVARTISWDQVNRKMYTSSDGRWKNYEKHLGPMIDEVGPYL